MVNAGGQMTYCGSVFRCLRGFCYGYQLNLSYPRLLLSTPLDSSLDRQQQYIAAALKATNPTDRIAALDQFCPLPCFYEVRGDKALGGQCRLLYIVPSHP